MQCPQCHGEFEPIEIRSSGNALVNVRRCTQCSGFWFPKPMNEPLQYEAVTKYDKPVPNYSLRNMDLICPNDKTLLTQAEDEAAFNGIKYWSCPDCDGTFFPKGQLASYSQWEQKRAGEKTNKGGLAKSQAAGAVSLMFVLVVMVMGSLGNSTAFNAAEVQTLPTAGPNVFTLILLALTYLAGTVLAVLGRKLVLIIIGWGVIITCLIGFAVIIFGP